MSDDAQRAQDRARFSLQGKALADLGQQVVRARAENRELRRRLASVEYVLDAVKRQVEGCETALKFYADLQSYRASDSPGTVPDMPVLDDSGWLARQVLYKTREAGITQAVRAELERRLSALPDVIEETPDWREQLMKEPEKP